MKNWAWLTVLLYVLCLAIIGVPLTVALAWPIEDQHGYLARVFAVGIAPVLILSQAVLLLVPLARVQERPVKRRNILASVIIGAIPMALLTVGILSAVILMVFGESRSGDALYNWPIVYAFGALWIVWGFLFWRDYAKSGAPALTESITRWLLRGSILELVVAVPSHVLSRRKHDCCAPGFTLLGIVTGLATALMAFGPGIFFLFAKRIQNKTVAKGSANAPGSMLH